ncbi:MAG: hypothetical protein WC788_01870 [Candidatus Paceibacterota bacterium]|jgi:hypothetical protein
MEKEYSEERAAFILIVSVLAGLLLVGMIIAIAEFGIIIAIKAFAMYLAVLFVIAAECTLFARLIFRLIPHSTFVRSMALCAVILPSIVAYMLVLVTYIRPWTYAEAGVPFSATPDLAFMFMNLTGAIVVVFTVLLSVAKKSIESLPNAIKAD